MPYLNLETATPGNSADITGQVRSLVERSQVFHGLVYLMTPDPEVALTVSEIPGAGPAMGSVLSLSLMVVDRQVFLPATQNIYLTDQKGPRRIRLMAKVLEGERPEKVV